MKDVCIVNQVITDEFKALDDENYQEEYKEHQRKLNIINSYEEEIKKVMFLSSGCVSETTDSFTKYGLGLKPNYIGVANLLNKIQSLKAKKLGLIYHEHNCEYYGNFVVDRNVELEHVLRFTLKSENKEYLNYFISIVNKYSLEFFNKEYFLRCEGSFLDSRYVLVTKDETWKMEYSRNSDTLHKPFEFILATLLPVFGWMFLFYSAYVAINLYFKHRGK